MRWYNINVTIRVHVIDIQIEDYNNKPSESFPKNKVHIDLVAKCTIVHIVLGIFNN